MNGLCAVNVGVNEINEINEMNVYPNPATNIINIQLSEAKNSKIYLVSIYNMIGQIEKQFNWNGAKTAIDLSNSPKGIYIVRVSNGKDNEFKKLIVE